jgi:hypothetical protein
VFYDTLVLEERPKKQALKQSENQSEKKHNPVKPAPDHPWKQQAQKRPRISYFTLVTVSYLTFLS